MPRGAHVTDLRRTSSGLRGQAAARTPVGPIRALPLDIERLRPHGARLARAHHVLPNRGSGVDLLGGLDQDARRLTALHRAIIETVRAGRDIVPAEEWFLDNHHLVDDQVASVREHLPRSLQRRLPVLRGGRMAGRPRVHALAWDHVAHTDSVFDLDAVVELVRGYQDVQPLLQCELWTLPIVLRLVLVENLRRLATEVAAAREARAAADRVADLVLTDEPRLVAAGHQLLQRLDHTPLADAFTVRLVQRLRDRDPSTTPAVGWIGERLAAAGTTPVEVVAREHQAQAASNATVRHVITSMRQMSSVDWRGFVQNVSLVDRLLGQVYPLDALDFATRDEYCRQVEQIADRAPMSEVEVARAAARLASEARDPLQQEQATPLGAHMRAEEDPGHHLLGDGRAAFERHVGHRTRLRVRVARRLSRLAIAAYVAAVATVTALQVAALAVVSIRAGLENWLVGALVLLAITPASETATAFVQRATARLVPPRRLPKLDLQAGIPETLGSLVVVPTLLTSVDDTRRQLEVLEAHFLANSKGSVQFALLSDFTDAPARHVDGDEDILEALVEGVANLNRIHPATPEGDVRFVVLHRRRVHNPAQGCWMGWERKRGKLHELNRLLRGAHDTTFLTVSGVGPAVAHDVRYVVTLDADTRLPRGAVHQLVGAIAHPMNRAVFDVRTRTVVEGHGILQPRITPTLPGGPTYTLYQRAIRSGGGVDPYASAASDLYQDLAHQGSYTGKGVYDVDAFEASLDGRVPDNSLLSHDLFEGTFARSGLVSDIELFEDFPTNYLADARRRHRWVRGDWQLVPWILGHARDAHGTRAGWRLPAPARWKMTENLRRSLVAPTSLALLVAAMAAPHDMALLWAGLAVASVAVPAVVPVIDGLRPRRHHGVWPVLRAVGRDAATAVIHVSLWLITLPDEARLMVDAAGRTLVRVYVTRRRLLEWTTAAHTSLDLDTSVRTFVRHMRGGLLVAAVAVGLSIALDPAGWPVIVAVGTLWLGAPLAAAAVSSPPRRARGEDLAPRERQELRLVARQTWRYFETVAFHPDHALPPDNVQDDPEPVIARRTSPTNIGLTLLACTSAHDFGWIGSTDLARRLERILDTVDRLPTYRGHLFNWYDSVDLRPLDPLYVSTVDSGNLAGHLLTVAQACRAVANEPVSRHRVLAGVRDSVLLALGDVEDDDTRAAAARLLDLCDESSIDPPGIQRHVDLLTEAAASFVDAARAATTSATQTLWWAEATARCVASHREAVVDTATHDATPDRSAAERLETLAMRAEARARTMDLRCLYDEQRRLFRIGHRVADDTPDPGSYDLLASEARLASFVAIATDQVPAQHWFALGRPLAAVDGGAALLSWSGSMFEYLMPTLVMREPPESLLASTAISVVHRQIEYGRQRGVPWGVSESAHNVRDRDLTYQYRDFGVPGLGLRRGLGSDLVIAPYATALAAMIAPRSALRNLRRLTQMGALGDLGYLEAIDLTPRNLPAGSRRALVRAHMTHHQGMTLVALDNVLNGGIVQDRFHTHPLVRATELLLQERAPRTVARTRPLAEGVRIEPTVRDLVAPTLRAFSSAHDLTPRTHLLSNGHYTVMITAAGSGFSRRGELAVTRWREDSTRDGWGTYVILRDVDRGDVWSAGFQPTGTEADDYEVVYLEDRARIVQRMGDLDTELEVVVSPKHDAELRRVSLTNHGDETRTVDVTTCAEVVLDAQAADEAHPAFGNLFVETEWVESLEALLATRRPRSVDGPQPWLAHLLVVDHASDGQVQFETDRVQFIGRGRTLRTARAIVDGDPLSGTVGTVLDPIVALRRRVSVPPGRTVRLLLTTIVESSREAVLEVAGAHQHLHAFHDVSALAWTHAQVQLHHLGITHDEANLYQRLANRMLYLDPSLRAPPEVLAANRSGQRGLWPHAVSGDLPIALVHVERDADRPVVHQLLHAFEYWRLKGVRADLVIVNATGASYSSEVHDRLEGMIRAMRSAVGDGPGDVFLLRDEHLSDAERTLLRAAARLEIQPGAGSLSQYVSRTHRSAFVPVPVTREPGRPPFPSVQTMPDSAVGEQLERFNGIGGFSADGGEYVIVLTPGRRTPAPWINVVANESFGFQVSERGGGHTWSQNSREHRLTPWTNDAVRDEPGEVLYLRDEDTSDVWTPTAGPAGDPLATHVVRHGHGHSTFTVRTHDVDHELVQFVAPAAAVKFSRLRMHNRSDRRRELSVTTYVEWVLGVSRDHTAPHVVTWIDEDTGAMFARNPWNGEFAERVAFCDLSGAQTSWTADRLEFLGRNGDLDRPAFLEHDVDLSNRTGAGLDPCAVLRTTFVLAPDEATQVTMLLGDASGVDEARALVRLHRSTDPDKVLDDVRTHWEDVLGQVQVRTPQRSMDLLLNRWLRYQTLSCRVWARSAFQQSGGAYGFRDQLQDVMALTTCRPDLVRGHLLRAAAHQFPEGDVLHWWHPPSGRGVRTRISDDRVWLVHATVQYVDVTGDDDVLEAQVPWIDAPLLDDGVDEAYLEPTVTPETATLYEHCARALERSLEVGPHGLPLIGTGDWNDGMNRVGRLGRGESVWLAWFLVRNLRDFVPFALARGDHARADRWVSAAEDIRRSAEESAWDGAWYLRAFFDDGSALGSRGDAECEIDAIPQSWAVLSHAADPERARTALASSVDRLLRRDDGLMLLFAPPFDRTTRDPGYVRGYPPGLRENGGQYTHAAIWTVIAAAMVGDGDLAGELFALLDPIRHGGESTIDRYRAEPYVVAADVYSQAPHVGRAGWTWYTGAAGWMYRAGIEWILGLRVVRGRLHVDPCIPTAWDGYEATWRRGRTTWEIVVTNPGHVCTGVSSLHVDGRALARGAGVPLDDDGRVHRVSVTLG